MLHLSVELAEPDEGHAACLLLINASEQAARFRLPAGNWIRHIDTSTGATSDQLLATEENLPPACLWLASSQPLFIASRQP
jgi:hypothetical protein